MGLDKNTIGKAVRGGNMNITVLLSISNRWDFPITEFFTFVDKEECGDSYFISPKKYRSLPEKEENTVEEGFKIYKNSKNLSTESMVLRESKLKEIAILKDLIKNYQERVALLEDELLSDELKQPISHSTSK